MLNVPHLILRMVDSINVPVDKLVFVHNCDEGQPNERVAQLLQKFRTQRPSVINNVYVHTFRHNLGVSAAWNAIMLFHNAPWYLICNSDIAFLPHTLPRIVEAIDMRLPTCVWKLGLGMSAFAIANHTRRTTGLFDENYYPAYSEDCDYAKRLAITHCPTVEVNGMSRENYLHTGSASWRLSSPSSKVYKRVRHLGEGFNNWDYLKSRFGTTSCDDKWGHRPEDPTTWKLDTVRRRARGGPDGCVACGTYSQELTEPLAIEQRT